MHIAIISGSVREGRKTHQIADYLFQRLQKEADVDVLLLDLKSYDLPLYIENWKNEPDAHEKLANFGAALEKADAMILLSPEYHGSYSGVLKNALDHYWNEFEHKVIGVATASTGRMGGINASTQMQLLVLALNAYPVPRKLLVPFLDQFNQAENQAFFSKAVDAFLKDFLWLSRAVVAAKQNGK